MKLAAQGLPMDVSPSTDFLNLASEPRRASSSEAPTIPGRRAEVTLRAAAAKKTP
jgi:hypothetical protein